LRRGETSVSRNSVWVATTRKSGVGRHGLVFPPGNGGNGPEKVGLPSEGFSGIRSGGGRKKRAFLGTFKSRQRGPRASSGRGKRQTRVARLRGC